MRDRQPIRTARRSVRHDKRERLGLAQTLCVLCIEDHHTAGRKHDPTLTAPSCKKHHREIHEQMLRAGISLRYERDPVRRAATAMRAMAVYRRAEAEAMDRWADLLGKTGGQPK
jgi:hypothetical protein